MPENTASPEAVQCAEGRSHAPGRPWRPNVHLQWREAGYEAAMHAVIDVANGVSGRPGATSRDVLAAIVNLAVGVIELRDPDDEWFTQPRPSLWLEP